MSRTFRICSTSDTHGHIFPVDYATDAFKPCGLLDIAADVHALAAQPGPDGEPIPTIALDAGDTLQGTPYSQLFVAGDASEEDRAATRGLPHPIAAAFNAVGYQFVTLGNHDFNYGRGAIAAYLDALDARCVCANVRDLTGQLPIARYAFLDLPNGIRLGVTGLVTDWVNVWEAPAHLRGLEVTDTLAAAREMSDFLRPRCDVSVCIYHGGYERDVKTGAVFSETTENRAWQIAHDLDFDVLISGHQHISMPGATINGTATVQTCATATEFAELICTLEDDGSFHATSRLVPVGDRHEDEPYATLLPYEERTEHWLTGPVGTLTRAIPDQTHLDVAMHGSELAALFNAVQLDASGARIAAASLTGVGVGSGFPQTVTRSAVVEAYPFANTLAVLAVTPDALKAALERCAEYFDLDEDGRPCVSTRFLKPKVEHYNYDYYAGLAYTFDLTKPVGSRVTSLTLADGSPLPDGPIELCVNSYRASGTGGYEALAACPVVRTIDESMQELIVRYLERHSPWAPHADGPTAVVTDRRRS
ncbi:bifunctional metallophosphatase/5'-nucleotidase [Bifidobacterium avesanii]|uniref:Bifunctional metallophosphatase/5'-nucleotidase n=1 Tax=Bifidobacterium avesanii TaxID=1798157 RepID=A0A7K3TJY4_9BIFI|nr:bifunctional UDP-sugar hydrolase/5'-nucleotidase [Bifidobacterium avesanii]KAB8288136.1 bifunctional metallophosphatase/5'-nucleotidase [Bifidobacterium avesanii]NEG79276.1 bifunctional metallophosphatase/5'-nucleotidase [Bifidobacterium avesanii]